MKRKLPKTIKVSGQAFTPTTYRRDIKRTALRPGLRISKTGKKYWETRRNRSDVMPTKKF